MNELYTQVGNGAYHLQFNTDNKNNFETIQTIARMCVNEQEIVLTNYKSINIQKQKNIEFAPIKRGHWCIDEYEYFYCSLCGRAYYNGCDSTIEAKSKLNSGNYYPYCPFCGAQMSGNKVNDNDNT